MMKNSKGGFKNNRIWYLDILRIVATFCVIVAHLSSGGQAMLEVRTYEWQILNVWQGSIRWTVPIFVMISGALFLGRNSTLKQIFQKNVFRILTAFVFWSVLYVIVDLLRGEYSSMQKIAIRLVGGHYHMWFLFMIVGLYLIVPFLRKIVVSRELMQYFLILTLVCTFCIPQAVQVLSLINESLGAEVNEFIGRMQFHFTLGYTGYFVLGYYLYQTELSKKVRRIIYVLSILGFLSTFGTAAVTSIYTGVTQKMFYSNLSVNVLLESIGVFVFFQYNVRPEAIGERMQKLITVLSKYSFGIYLAHVMVIELLRDVLGVTALSFNPLFSTVLIAVLVFGISYVIAYVCHHIPVLSKYIV